ncbi:MAG: 3-isopropylmalate dehydratase large subunit [Clostridia bacterium]|jgi:3-isopropylmalate/(R)-2-methylmalate dehydratase large subunit|nr:3-isopropylmalate dehydratase large subunit [Clostridia bacterium]
MGKTIVEKIFSAHANKDVRANDIVVAEIDRMMAHDGNGPLAIDIFYQLGGERLAVPEKTFFVLDHYIPCPNEDVARIHAIIRNFVKKMSCVLFDAQGICHQIMMEKAGIQPGHLVVGSDSHTTTYGALNAFSTGVGSTDFAAAMLTGQLWFLVPETIEVQITGKLRPGVMGKDLVLHLAAVLKADGATYQVLEFKGEAVKALSMDERITMANMAVEMGAKAGIFEFDEKTAAWYAHNGLTVEKDGVTADSDAVYAGKIEIDASALEPMIAKPHAVDNVSPIGKMPDTPINQASLGSCTNGRISDLATAAAILKGKKINKDVRMYVTPASRAIYQEAMQKGYLNTLTEAGAVIIPPSCGWCIGVCNGIPGDDDKVISTANRNFKGRMGNRYAEIYLASPATVAASAIYGRITDPRNLL